MKEVNDIKKLEKRLYFSYLNDGLADILMGLWMMLAGLFMLIDQAAFMGLSGLPILFYIPIKKGLIIPRMGDVTFSKDRKRKISNVLVFSIIAGAVLLLLIIFHFVNGANEQFMRTNIHILFGLIIAILFCFIALFTAIIRFYLYALFCMILFALDPVIFNSIPLTQLVFGAVVCIIGLIYLVRFIMNNPVIDQDGKN